jgi:hypothetical protein
MMVATNAAMAVAAVEAAVIQSGNELIVFASRIGFVSDQMNLTNDHSEIIGPPSLQGDIHGICLLNWRDDI